MNAVTKMENTLPGTMPTRHEFGAVVSLGRGELMSAAVAAQAKALIEARYIMAIQRPRNWDQVRQDLLKECRRPSFANNKSVFYIKPIGQGVQGLGIRFAEAAVRLAKNITVEQITTYDDERERVVRVVVTDLEANVPYSRDVTVQKTVERSKPMDDGSYLSVRMNSYGKPSYTVPGTDDDILNKEQALVSKAIRTLALRVMPGDILDECEATILATRRDEAAHDPDGTRKQIADAFIELNVKVAELEEYIGHKLDQCTPAELVDLRGLYGAIKDGEATWAAALEQKRSQDAEKARQADAVAKKQAAPTKPERGVNAAEKRMPPPPAQQPKTNPAATTSGPPAGHPAADDTYTME